MCVCVCVCVCTLVSVCVTDGTQGPGRRMKNLCRFCRAVEVRSLVFVSQTAGVHTPALPFPGCKCVSRSVVSDSLQPCGL